MDLAIIESISPKVKLAQNWNGAMIESWSHMWLWLQWMVKSTWSVTVAYVDGY